MAQNCYRVPRTSGQRGSDQRQLRPCGCAGEAVCPTRAEARGGRVLLNINLAVLLAFIVVVRLRRRTEARSRNDEKLTVVIVLVLGLLLAPTDFGQWVLQMTGQLVEQVAQVKL